MSLDAIPDGSLCVLDTNILLYAEQGASRQAQRLLQRVARGEVVGILPQPVWQELTHKLMLAEALAQGHVKGGNPARQLAAKPEVVKRLIEYRAKIHALVQLGLGYEACSRSDLLERAVQLQERYGLLTNDALILSIALRLGAGCLVSSDNRYRAVRDIKVFAPSDLHVGSSEPKS